MQTEQSDSENDELLNSPLIASVIKELGGREIK